MSARTPKRLPFDIYTLAASLGQPVKQIRRTPYPYRTSHDLDELEVILADGTRREYLFKDSRRSALGAVARRAKPAFLFDESREGEAYRALKQGGLAQDSYQEAGRNWILLKKVRGMELWQVAEVEAWAEAARWASRLHSHFAAQPPLSAHLLRYDLEYFRIWPTRAMRLHAELAGIVGRYQRVLDLLGELPMTLIHGEYYPSNILVSDGIIVPIDWEMAGIGPGVIDLAALVTGWGHSEIATIIEAYGGVKNPQLDAARLHLALQWLGRQRAWTPPPEHDFDWLAEAFSAANRLGL